MHLRTVKLRSALEIVCKMKQKVPSHLPSRRIVKHFIYLEQIKKKRQYAMTEKAFSSHDDIANNAQLKKKSNF